MSDPQWEFYQRYYAAVAGSRVYADYCAQVYGRNFGQHGFADMDQVQRLVEVAGLAHGDRVLELGCGSGGIAATVADVTDAVIVGTDYAQKAVQEGQKYAAERPGRLFFAAADIAALPFAPTIFDAVIAIDALYFTPLLPTVARIGELLKPGGRLVACYSQGANPQEPLAVFRRDTLAPDRTDLAVALLTNGFELQAWDLTSDDRQHALRKRAVLAELKSQFEREGTIFLFESRWGEANGVLEAIAAGAHRRYLYRAWRPPPA